MVSKARANADTGEYANVDFRLGEIEHLPVADGTVDGIISNCVINLSPDKSAVFADAFRVLRPGGRLAISDVVASAELPAEIRDDLSLYSGCMAGASLISDLQAMLADAGFEGHPHRAEGREQGVHRAVGARPQHHRLRRLGDDRGDQAGAPDAFLLLTPRRAFTICWTVGEPLSPPLVG